jgi:hypothetical protein
MEGKPVRWRQELANISSARQSEFIRSKTYRNLLQVSQMSRKKSVAETTEIRVLRVVDFYNSPRVTTSSDRFSIDFNLLL